MAKQKFQNGTNEVFESAALNHSKAKDNYEEDFDEIFEGIHGTCENRVIQHKIKNWFREFFVLRKQKRIK